MRAVVRAQIALALALSLCLWGLGAIAGAAPPRPAAGPRGSFVGQVNPDPSRALAYWTPARLRAATPLPTPVASPAGASASSAPATGPPSFVPPAAPGAAAGRLQRGELGAAQASCLGCGGTDTGDSTVFPNRVNGQVFFNVGPNNFSCSGSVVDTPHKNTVLTAGHCIVDENTGAPSQNVVFVPGYRDGAAPFGVWPATRIEATRRWTNSVATNGGNGQNDDEAVDVGAMQLASDSAGRTIQDVVGAFGIGFNQSRDQNYTEFGYPGQLPYDGSKLYKTTSPHTGDDNIFSPPTLQINSDFNAGSSGGPFVIGNTPTILSVTAYGYPGDIDHIYGPYFSNDAQAFYQGVAQMSFRLGRVRLNKSAGTAMITVDVPDAGRVVLSGKGLRVERRKIDGATKMTLPLIPKGRTKSQLRANGVATIDLNVTFTLSGSGPETKSRSVRLVQR